MDDRFGQSEGCGSSIRVRAILPSNSGNSEPQIKVFDDVFLSPDGHMYVMSNRTPEEVAIFGLAFDEHTSFVRRTTVTYIPPVERGIVETRKDGLCIFCQLILLPDPPEHTVHFPSFQLLMDAVGTCQLCSLISVAFGIACPELKQLYYDGYQPLHDRNNTLTRITIETSRFDSYNTIVACCGDPRTSKFRGQPLVWSTSQRLGETLLQPAFRRRPKSHS